MVKHFCNNLANAQSLDSYDYLQMDEEADTEDAGHFYGILETRPYMCIRKAYLEVLLEIIMSGDEQELSEFESMGMYRPFSVEEVILATVEASYLYLLMNHFLSRIYTETTK